MSQTNAQTKAELNSNRERELSEESEIRLVGMSRPNVERIEEILSGESEIPISSTVAAESEIRLVGMSPEKESRIEEFLTSNGVREDAISSEGAGR